MQFAGFFDPLAELEAQFELEDQANTTLSENATQVQEAQEQLEWTALAVSLSQTVPSVKGHIRRILGRVLIAKRTQAYQPTVLCIMVMDKHVAVGFSCINPASRKMLARRFKSGKRAFKRLLDNPVR